MEKLLRSCNIETIYILIRSKKSKDVKTRLEDIFNDPVIIYKFIKYKKIYKTIFF